MSAARPKIDMLNQINSETSDPELVQRARAGELDAFEALTTRYLKNGALNGLAHAR